MATKQLIPLALNPIGTPGSPANGWIYYDSTAKRIESYDGSAWQQYLASGDVGTSGTKVPLLNGTNTWSNAQTFSAGISVTSSVQCNGDLYSYGSAAAFSIADRGGGSGWTIYVTGSAFRFYCAADKVTISSAGVVTSVVGFCSSTYYSAGTSTTFNYNNGAAQYFAPTAGATLTMSNMPAVCDFYLVIKNTTGSSITMGLPAGTGTSPVTIAAGDTQVFAMSKIGSIYYRPAGQSVSSYTYP